MRQTRVSRLTHDNQHPQNVTTSSIKPIGTRRSSSGLAATVSLFVLVFGLWLMYLHFSSNQLQTTQPSPQQISTSSLITLGTETTERTPSNTDNNSNKNIDVDDLPVNNKKKPSKSVKKKDEIHTKGKKIDPLKGVEEAVDVETKKNSRRSVKRTTEVDLTCADPVWCTIPMPIKRSFAFTPVADNMTRWRQAQQIASTATSSVFTRSVRGALSHPDDFLDGDSYGQNYDRMVDIFITRRTMLHPLTASEDSEAKVDTKEKQTDNSIRFTRQQYANAYASTRAPLVQLGTYKYDTKRFVKTTGDNLHVIDLLSFITNFEELESQLSQPCVFMSTLSKDWGFLSREVSGRVGKPETGSAARVQEVQDKFPYNEELKSRLVKVLDSKKVVLLVIHQHSSFSHPKLLTLPYGIPFDSYFDRKALWDSINQAIRKPIQKTHLIYQGENLTALSKIVVDKLSPKFTSNLLESDSLVTSPHADASPQERSAEHYQHVSRARFGLFLPETGFDSFRHWEMLYMGLIGVAERGRGLDRMTAYVEAIYHEKVFDFHRLRQSYWYGVIYEASKKKSALAMLDKFPMPDEEDHFVTFSKD